MQLRDDGARTLGPLVMPPVTLALTQPLRLLVISPRDEIWEVSWALLDPRMPMSEAPELEREVERLNVSALVVDQVAIATYPTLIPENTPPASALQIVGHEWTHTALFFTALGQAYGSSPQARNINETTADVVGNEVANGLLRKVGEEPRFGVATTGSEPQIVRELRTIRQQVDAMLAAHDVEGAEAYMEVQRQRLNAEGYHIRRLNQAYFAFHGNYEEGPAASTVVPEGVRAVRASSSSLADFLSRIGGVTTVDQLRQLAGTGGD